jgi:hypothetical protein
MWMSLWRKPRSLRQVTEFLLGLLGGHLTGLIGSLSFRGKLGRTKSMEVSLLFRRMVMCRLLFYLAWRFEL